MINDPTILRLSSGDAHPETNLDRLAALDAAICAAFKKAVEPFGKADVRLFLVASPTRGSLEIFLRPEIVLSFDVSVVIAQINDAASREQFDLGDAASLGAFLWAVVFGGKGVFDLWRSKISAPETSNPTPSDAVRKLLLNRQVSAVFKRVVDASLQLGVLKVELHIADNDTTVISERELLQGKGVIAQKVVKNMREESPRRMMITLRSEKPAMVVYDGKQYPAVLADFIDSGYQVRGVLLWASQLPIPEVGAQSEVNAVPVVHPEQIEAVDPVSLALGVSEISCEGLHTAI